MQNIKIGIFLQAFPVSSETFIVTKILGLMDAGFDVQVFSTQPSNDWDKFEVLDNYPNIKNRIHIMPPFRSIPHFLVKGTTLFLNKLIHHPRALLRLVRHSWRHRKKKT